MVWTQTEVETWIEVGLWGAVECTLSLIHNAFRRLLSGLIRRLRISNISSCNRARCIAFLRARARAVFVSCPRASFCSAAKSLNAPECTHQATAKELDWYPDRAIMESELDDRNVGKSM